MFRPSVELAWRTSASVNTGMGPWRQRLTSSGPIHLSGGVASSDRKIIRDETGDLRADHLLAFPGPVSSLTMLKRASEPRKRRHTVPKCSMAGTVSRPENRMVRDELYACCDVIGTRAAIANHGCSRRKVVF